MVRSNFKDLTGMKFGKLLVLKRDGSTNDGRAKFLCQCDCGNVVSIVGRDLRKGTMSCGCYRRDKNRELHTTHGKTNTRIYKVWRGMKERCYNSNNKDYKNYGARGIRICDDWLNNFQSFYNWSMENGYSNELSIDRVDVNGNYEPLNCRWVSAEQQANNTRANVYYTHNGKTQSMSMWCKELGLSYVLIRDRHKLHPDISFEKLFVPLKEDIELSYNGKTQCIKKWANELEILESTIYNRIYRYGETNIDKILYKGDKRVAYITYKGKRQSLKEWCDELKLNYNTIKSRYNKHPEYSPEELFDSKRK